MDKNNKNKAASKNIYLIIKNNEIKYTNEKIEENIFLDLNEKYFKIKDSLIRCGNIAVELNKEETKEIIYSFLNSKKYLEK